MKDVGSDVVVEYGGSTVKKAETASSKKQNKVSDVIVDKIKDAMSESQRDAQTETASSSTSQTTSSTSQEASPSETQTTAIACEYPQTGVKNDAGFGMTIMSASVLMLLIVFKAVFEKRGKVSLRASAFQQIHRVESIASALGVLGDMLVSTTLSCLIALASLGGGALYGFHLITTGPGLSDIAGTVIPALLVIAGTVLIALNVLFVNPSQGSQFVVSFKYWKDLVNDSQKGYLQKPKPFKFSKNSLDKSIIETISHKKRCFFNTFKVQGKVSTTSFDDELEYLSKLNKEALGSLERDTVRTTMTFIGKPKIRRKETARNATPEMEERISEIERVAKSIKNAQTLETFVVIASPSAQALRNKSNAQRNFWERGLVTTYYGLKEKEFKKFMRKVMG